MYVYAYIHIHTYTYIYIYHTYTDTRLPLAANVDGVAPRRPGPRHEGDEVRQEPM